MFAEIVSELISVQLTITGISFSVFTVLYSIIIGKLDQLRTISKLIKSGNCSFDVMQAERFCKESISLIKRINLFCIIICCFSIFLAIGSWICVKMTIGSVALFILTCLHCADFIAIITLIILIFYRYFKQTSVC